MNYIVRYINTIWLICNKPDYFINFHDIMFASLYIQWIFHKNYLWIIYFFKMRNFLSFRQILNFNNLLANFIFFNNYFIKKFCIIFNNYVFFIIISIRLYFLIFQLRNRIIKSFPWSTLILANLK